MVGPSASDKPHLLVVSPESLNGSIAGPAARARELARVLEPHASVTLAAVERASEVDPEAGHVSLVRERPASWRRPLAGADVILAQPPPAPLAAACRRSGARLIYDLCTPEVFELATAHERLRDRDRIAAAIVGRARRLAVDRALAALSDADLLLCASERQRALWLGAMLAEGALGQERYRRDPTLRSYIDTVAFGITSAAPQRRGSGIRGRFPALDADDEVVLWNGGIWNWLDPETAVAAVGLLESRRPRLRLVFMGDSQLVVARGSTARAKAAAAARGLLDRVIFFNDGWVPYDERAAWLLDAACAISTHRDQLEAQFAFRSRLLDCFWCGLPVVCSAGDELSEVVARDDLGGVAPCGDAGAVAAALDSVLSRGRDAYRERLEVAAREFRWERVAEPIVRFLGAGAPAARLRHRALRNPSRFARELRHRSAYAVVARTRRGVRG
jgi:glycosyltransferase involved in cell wall biosynthesis